MEAAGRIVVSFTQVRHVRICIHVEETDRPTHEVI